METIDKERIIRTIEHYERKGGLPIGKYISDALNMLSKDFSNQAIIAVLFFLSTCMMPLLTPPIVAGWYIYIHLRHRGQHPTLDTLSRGLSHYLPFFLYELLFILVTFGVIIPVVGISEEFLSPEIAEIAGPLAMIALAPFYYLLCTWLFFVPFFILFGKMNFFSACKWSIRLANKNFGWLLLIIFLASLISSTGINACYVGGLFTYPLGMIICYLVFEDFFREELEPDELDEVIKHLV